MNNYTARLRRLETLLAPPAPPPERPLRCIVGTLEEAAAIRQLGSDERLLLIDAGRLGPEARRDLAEGKVLRVADILNAGAFIPRGERRLRRGNGAAPAANVSEPCPASREDASVVPPAPMPAPVELAAGAIRAAGAIGFRE